jgi:integrase
MIRKLNVSGHLLSYRGSWWVRVVSYMVDHGWTTAKRGFSVEKGVKLTKRVVDATEPPDKRYEIWDSELAGFGLRVEPKPSGKKTFFVRYRVGGGRKAVRRNMTIGSYGPLTPEKARGEAKKILGQSANGHDPADVRNARRREMTVAELVDLYEQKGCVIQRGSRQGQPMKPMTKRQTLQRLRNHVVSLIGRKRIGDLRPKDVEQLARDIAAHKTNKDKKTGFRTRVIVRGGQGAARKVVRDLSAVFTFAQRQELRPDNPCTHAAVNKVDNKRKRYLTLEQVHRLGTALRQLEEEGANPKAINIARLWALTGFRRYEAAGLKRAEVDFGRGGVRLIDSKEGESIRPLGAPALALLRSLPVDDKSPYFFPAERGDGFYVGTKRIWPRAIKRAGLTGVTPHTLRHTVGSTAVSFGESLKMAGAILGHATVAATEVYAHLQHDPSKQVADRISNAISAALDGNSTAEIVPLRRA